MKKLFTLLAITSMTYAATDSATLNLRGVVDRVVDISVAAESVAQALDLSSTATNLKVATVTERTNDTGSFSVSVASQNGGKLKHTNGNVFNYTMTYGGQNVNLSTGTSFSRAGNALSSQAYDVNVSYTGVADSLMVAGDYTDVVTFTITQN